MVKYLNQFIDTRKLTMVEIGSWTGVSAEIFSHYFRKVICVDAWKSSSSGMTVRHNMQAVEDLFDKRMASLDNIVKIKQLSKNAAVMVDFCDIVYIDGTHTYEGVQKDLALWAHKATIAVTGHDYWKRKFPGVIRAVDDFFGKPDKVFPDTSWVVFKRKMPVK